MESTPQIPGAALAAVPCITCITCNAANPEPNLRCTFHIQPSLALRQAFTVSETSNVAGSGFGLPRAGRVVDLASPARGGITRANYPHFCDGSSCDVA